MINSGCSGSKRLNDPSICQEKNDQRLVLEKKYGQNIPNSPQFLDLHLTCCTKVKRSMRLKLHWKLPKWSKSFGFVVWCQLSVFFKAVLSTNWPFRSRGRHKLKSGKGGAPLLSFSLCTTFSSCWWIQKTFVVTWELIKTALFSKKNLFLFLIYFTFEKQKHLCQSHNSCHQREMRKTFHNGMDTQGHHPSKGSVTCHRTSLAHSGTSSTFSQPPVVPVGSQSHGQTHPFCPGWTPRGNLPQFLGFFFSPIFLGAEKKPSWISMGCWGPSR